MSEQPLTLQELTEKVTRLENDNQGWKGRLKLWGAILGLLAAVVSIPQGVINLWASLNTRPETQVYPEPEVSMTYDPAQKTLQFDFDFTLSNNGKAHDTIKRVDARLERINPAAGSPLLIFGDNDFKFTENNVAIPRRFPLNKESTRAVGCQLTAHLTEEHRQQFQPKTRWKLTVELTAEYKTHPLKYCFDVTQTMVNDVFSAQGKAERKLLNPLCQGISE